MEKCFVFFFGNETDNELADFHGLPLNMRNGHSLDGVSPGSDLNEGINFAISVWNLTVYNIKVMSTEHYIDKTSFSIGLIR